jgi:hypothetical protein
MPATTWQPTSKELLHELRLQLPHPQQLLRPLPHQLGQRRLAQRCELGCHVGRHQLLPRAAVELVHF